MRILILPCLLLLSLTARTPAAPPACAPIVIPDCRLAVVEKQDVPSRRDGTLLFIGTDIAAGEQVPADQLITIHVGNDEKRFRRLHEGEAVQAGQLLGMLDDELSRHDCGIKAARLAASQADLEAAIKTTDETRSRYETQMLLQRQGRGVTSEEDVRASKLNWERAYYEAVSRREAVALAELELRQAEAVCRMYQLRSAIPGVIRSIARHPGESVKDADTILQVQNLARLRVEGQVDVQHLPRLRPGLHAVVEVPRLEAPQQVLIDHLQEVTGVAVSKDTTRPLIVSASADGTARVWDRASQRVLRVLAHAAAVHAVTCTPPGTAGNWCLTGAADGTARLWDLDSDAKGPLRELSGQHHGAVVSVAFGLDGKTCITGGEDREICLWDATTGKLVYRLPTVHGGAVTALQFAAPGKLVSVGRDNTLRLWSLKPDGASLEATFDRRTGDVVRLGVSPDGRRVLFDQGTALRLLSLPEGRTEGVLERASAGNRFTTLALFSPDGRLVLTAADGSGPLQLWRAPQATAGGQLLRSLVCSEPLGITSACFAPDGSFLAAGSREGRVVVWPTPAAADVDRRLTAEVTLIERVVETSSHQVRIWAELPNPDGRLLPGTSVTLIIEPGAP